MKTKGMVMSRMGIDTSALRHFKTTKRVDKIFKICYNIYSKIRKEKKIKMKRREDIVLRIEKLKTNQIDNAKLIHKWERILRNFDRFDNSNT